MIKMFLYGINIVTLIIWSYFLGEELLGKNWWLFNPMIRLIITCVMVIEILSLLIRFFRRKTKIKNSSGEEKEKLIKRMKKELIIFPIITLVYIGIRLLMYYKLINDIRTF